MDLEVEFLGHHVAFSRLEGGPAKLYLDGQVVDTRAPTNLSDPVIVLRGGFREGDRTHLVDVLAWSGPLFGLHFQIRGDGHKIGGEDP